MRTVFFLFMSFWFLACDKNDDPGYKPEETTINWGAAADSSSLALMDNYWNGSDKCFNFQSNGTVNFQYWPQAHALDVMLDAYTRTNQGSYLNVINSWYEGVKIKNGNTFLNVFYDDMEWNALAMLRAFEATGDEKFKTSSMEVWNDIKTGWNTQGGGGIAWKKDQLWSKNACSNGPASILAARMYQKFGNESDKEWALKIYNWEKEYLFNPSNGAVYDNLNASTGAVQSSWIFTYNQGTFLGSAVELFKITGEVSYLNDAVKAADYTLNNLVNGNDQLLKDEGSGDGGLFKGIFVRYFTQLIMLPELSEGTRNRYINFLKHNAETLWTKGTNKNLMMFGSYWKNKPENGVDLNVNVSGCMLIEATALLKSKNMF